MSNDQQPVQPPTPAGGWGDGYESDSTAFIQPHGEPPGQSAVPGGPDPLAVPEAGPTWAPPAAEPQGALPVVPTPAATTDPAAPGQWTLPFAGDGPQARPNAAAAMGQGAALTGPYEARARNRRPLGSGSEPRAQTPNGGTHAPVPGMDWHTAPGPGANGAGDAGGQWSVPFAAADSPDDSGEYLAAATPPAPAPEPDHGPAVPSGDAGPPGHAPPGPEHGPQAEPDPEAPDSGPGTAAEDEHPRASYILRVNGVDRPVTDAWIGESLLYVLRERLGLAGAKDGCSQGECGACSVQVDGRLVASCLVPAATTAGSEVRTVEGLAADGAPSDVQRALAACGAVQCGFCVPGMAMALHDLLEGNHEPTELETRQAISGNLCRCSGYRGVLDAVRTVIAGREADAGFAGNRDAHRAQHAQEAREAQDAGARIPHQAGPPSDGTPPHHLPQDGGTQ